jgi:transglutaminase-like putative cysteine protease
MKKKFHCGCQLVYSVAAESTFIFNICVAKSEQQQILSERLIITPPLSYQEYLEPVLRNRFLRVNAPGGKLEVNYEAQVIVEYEDVQPDYPVEVSPAKLPIEVLHYLYPSRYCESDRLLRLTQKEFGDLPRDYARVQAICDWIYENVEYAFGSTNSQTSAFDTVTERVGVCRDFAHLGIAFCRALNIPARFAAGYAYQLNPPDFHAYFEAFLGDRWYLFDPTRLVAKDGLIRIGTGRDAADISFATIFGPVSMEEMVLSVHLDS